MSDMLDAILEEVSDFFTEDLQKEVKITKIDPNALRVWTETWKNVSARKPPDGGWDWVYKTKLLEKRYKKYFIGIAVWGEGCSLCGLALCSRSRGNDVLSIHYVEGAPSKDHPLKGYVFNIINTVLLEYAGIIKANGIRIMEPVNSLISFYKIYEYELHNKTLLGKRYCEKRMQK